MLLSYNAWNISAIQMIVCDACLLQVPGGSMLHSGKKEKKRERKKKRVDEWSFCVCVCVEWGGIVVFPNL